MAVEIHALHNRPTVLAPAFEWLADRQGNVRRRNLKFPNASFLNPRKSSPVSEINRSITARCRELSIRFSRLTKAKQLKRNLRKPAKSW